MNGRQMAIDMIDQKVAQLGAVILRGTPLRGRSLKVIAHTVKELNAVRDFLERNERRIANHVEKVVDR